MKKSFKLFLSLTAVFVVFVGINVNAEEPQWESDIEVVLPIHKTDENGKGLEGAVFTLKDFNDTISFSSSDKKGGDYLISTYKEDENVLDKVINSLPSNYKEVITGIKSWDDVEDLQNRKDMIVNVYSDYAYATFIVPFKLEESVAPEGYQQQDFVVTGMVQFIFDKMSVEMAEREDIEARSEYYDEFYDNGIYIHADLRIVESPNSISGFFSYDSSKDYGTLYQDTMKNIIDIIYDYDSYDSEEEAYEAVMKVIEDTGYNMKDVECPEIEREILKRDNFEDIQFAVSYNSCYSGGNVARRNADFRFSGDIENCYCVIQLKNKKKTIDVNPETASTVAILSLIALGSIGLIATRKTKKSN